MNGAPAAAGRASSRRRRDRRPAAELLECRTLLTRGGAAATPQIRALAAPAADLAVAVVSDPGPVRVGQALTFTVSVTNAGPDPATGVVLTDTPPVDAAPTAMPVVSQGDVAAGPGGTLVADLGTLAPGATATLRLVVVLTRFTPASVPNQGIAINRAVVRADQADPVPSNNAAFGAVGVVLPMPPPLQVVSLRRFGFHAQPTLLTLSFSTAVFPATGSDPSNYVVTAPGRDGRFGTRDDRVIPVDSATIDPATGDVTLALRRRLALSRRYQLRVNAAPPNGVTGMFGHPLDGDRDGQPGGDYVAPIVRGLLAGRADQAPGTGGQKNF